MTIAFDLGCKATKQTIMHIIHAYMFEFNTAHSGPQSYGICTQFLECLDISNND